MSPHRRTVQSTWNSAFKPALVGAFLSLYAVAENVSAEDSQASDLLSAITEGTTKFNFRYRYEFVDQENFDDDAGSSTLLSRLSWQSKPLSGLQFGVEADYVSVIGSERYNSTENGQTRYPVVADPEGFDLNQAYIRWRADNYAITAGRQRIVFEDQRFIGGVAWRQNEQTYDGLRATLTPTEKLTLDYSYVANVNRIFGPNDGGQPADWESNSHILHATLKPAEGHSLRAFAYLLDFENDNGVPNSTSTYGIGYNGNIGPLKLQANIATQSDYADSPLSYDADFLGLNIDYKLKPITLTAGYELLGSDDGVAAFRTPLATLHKFQGWADRFLNTPATGIKDLYFGAAGAIGPVKLAARWHDFSADEGGADYGTELNLIANYPVNKHVSMQLKFADYEADEFAVDTTRFWLSLIVKL